MLKAIYFFFLVEIWEGKFQDAFDCFSGFLFFVDCVSFFFGNVYLSIHFLEDHFLGDFGDFPLVDWVTGFFFTISKQNTLREIPAHGGKTKIQSTSVS